MILNHGDLKRNMKKLIMLFGTMIIIKEIFSFK